MELSWCFRPKGSTSRPADDGSVPPQPPTPNSSQNSSHFQGGKFISMLSSLLSLANLTVCSDVLSQSWSAIQETKVQFSNQLLGDVNVQFRKKVLRNYNIIVFVTSPITKSCLLEKTEVVSSSALPGYSFLLQSSRRNSSFSINEAALSLFHPHEGKLSALVDEVASEADSKTYIITGDGIAGSVASLFALRLLFKLKEQKELKAQQAKKPLCITFGSPLLGDSGLRSVLEHKTWNSYFLHVVSMDDCFPSLFFRPKDSADGQTTGGTSTYHPFGTFMFCSNSGGSCFENPESALDLLKRMSAQSGGNEQSFDYETIIANLRKDLICTDRTNLNAHGIGSSMGKTSVAAQYLAAFLQLQDVTRNSQLELLENEMSLVDNKRAALGEKAKKLNEVKISMAQIEWYKKTSEGKNTPYYDSYKNRFLPSDIDVVTPIRRLQTYWKLLVEEAAENSQKEEAKLRDRWLLGGTTYRKLVEPLAIAEYYRSENARNYITKGRSDEKLKHYKLLEQWFKPDLANKNTNHPPSLTDDSCFWAHVEEAIISCQNVIKGKTTGGELEKLKEFEEYVSERIEKNEVSSDIFLEKSSFMKWWKDYQGILDQKLLGTSYTSRLADIMNNRSCKRMRIC